MHTEMSDETVKSDRQKSRYYKINSGYRKEIKKNYRSEIKTIT